MQTKPCDNSSVDGPKSKDLSDERIMDVASGEVLARWRFDTRKRCFSGRVNYD